MYMHVWVGFFFKVVIRSVHSEDLTKRLLGGVDAAAGKADDNQSVRIAGF